MNESPMPGASELSQNGDQQLDAQSTSQQADNSADDMAQQDANEWQQAQDQLFPGLKSVNKQDKKDESVKPEEGAEEATKNSEDSENKESDEEQGAGDDSQTEGSSDKANDAAASARAARLANRQYSEQVASVKSDVMQKMYADAPTTLADADGDPINSIEDVMKLIDPRTGEAFTENDAAVWLLSAQQEFNKQVAEREKNAEKIAELNVDIKDQADFVNDKYGEFLKNNIKLRDKLWQQFEKTLKKDPDTGIIVEMPLSLEEFYESQLSPRIEAQQQIAQQQAQGQAVQQQAQQQQQVQKQQTRQDRSDIYGNGTGDATDNEEKEWAQARDAVFGPMK